MITENSQIINNPHDRVIKGSLGDVRVARDFFGHYLSAEIKSRVCLETLAIDNGSFVDPELKAT